MSPQKSFLPFLSAVGMLLAVSSAHATQNITVSPGVSTATLQSDVNSISAAGGGTLTFNSGTYNITASLELKSNVKLHGQGKQVTFLVGPSTAYSWPILEVNGNGITNVVIEQMTINGNIPISTYVDNANEPYQNQLGIHCFASNFQGCGPINVNNVEVINCNEGIGMGDVDQLTIDNCTVDNNGLKLSSGLYNHNIYLNSCSNLTVKNTASYSATRGNGLHLNSGGEQGFGYTVTNNNLSSNGSCGLNCQAQPYNVTISYNTCSHNGHAPNITAGTAGGVGLGAVCTTGGTITHNTNDYNNSYGLATYGGTWSVTYNEDSYNEISALYMHGTVTANNNTGTDTKAQ